MYTPSLRILLLFVPSLHRGQWACCLLAERRMESGVLNGRELYSELFRMLGLSISLLCFYLTPETCTSKAHFDADGFVLPSSIRI